VANQIVEEKKGGKRFPSVENDRAIYHLMGKRTRKGRKSHSRSSGGGGKEEKEGTYTFIVPEKVPPKKNKQGCGEGSATNSKVDTEKGGGETPSLVVEGEVS